MTHLPRAGMQHPHIFRRQNVHQRPRVHIPDLDEIGLEREDIRLEDGKGLRVALPCDEPLGEGAPAVPVHKEGEVRVAQQEVAVDALDVDRAQALLGGDEVERGVGLVEKRLGNERVESHDFEAPRAADAQGGAEEMDRVSFGGNVEFLMRNVRTWDKISVFGMHGSPYEA